MTLGAHLQHGARVHAHPPTCPADRGRLQVRVAVRAAGRVLPRLLRRVPAQGCGSGSGGRCLLRPAHPRRRDVHGALLGRNTLPVTLPITWLQAMGKGVAVLELRDSLFCVALPRGAFTCHRAHPWLPFLLQEQLYGGGCNQTYVVLGNYCNLSCGRCTVRDVPDSTGTEAALAPAPAVLAAAGPLGGGRRLAA